MILNTLKGASSYLFDTGWQTAVMDKNITEYAIPLIIEDLSSAFKVDISHLDFPPRIILLRPLNYNAAKLITASDATSHRLLSVLTQTNPITGARVTSIDDKNYTGFADIVLSDNSEDKAGSSVGNIGLYPKVISGNKYLVLARYSNNTIVNNTVLKARSWVWRVIG